MEFDDVVHRGTRRMSGVLVHTERSIDAGFAVRLLTGREPLSDHVVAVDVEGQFAQFVVGPSVVIRDSVVVVFCPI